MQIECYQNAWKTMHAYVQGCPCDVWMSWGICMHSLDFLVFCIGSILEIAKTVEVNGTCFNSSCLWRFQLGPSFLRRVFITHSNLPNYWDSQTIKFERQKLRDEIGTLGDVCVVYGCDKIRVLLIKKSLGNTGVIAWISMYTEKFPVVHSRKHSLQMLQIVFSHDANGIF